MRPAPTVEVDPSGYLAAIVDSSPVPGETSGLKGETRIEEPTRAQRAIVRRSAEVRATIPDLDLGTEIDMAACLELRSERGCSMTAMLVRACALALREVPRANAAYRDGRFELYSRVNVGVCIETEDAYLFPTVIDADAKALEELTDEIYALNSRARAGALTPPELAGATFSLSDLGAYGVARYGALVNPPQAAALAAGTIRAVPVLREGAIVPGHTMTLTLACDHRILYGAEAGRLLGTVQQRLEEGRL